MLKSIARAVLTLILFVALVGFGLCGAYGTLFGVGSLFDRPGEMDSTLGRVMIVFGLAGLVVAVGCWKALAVLMRGRR